jgi:hypothetical protein
VMNRNSQMKKLTTFTMLKVWTLRLWKKTLRK